MMRMSLVFMIACALIIVSSSLPTFIQYRVQTNTVDECPTNRFAWMAASARLNCSTDYRRRNRYHCMPNQERTRLLEFCYHQNSLFYERGTCPLLNGSGYIHSFNCSKLFGETCPPNSFFSDELYLYPACTQVNKTHSYLYGPSYPRHWCSPSNFYDERGIQSYLTVKIQWLNRNNCEFGPDNCTCVSGWYGDECQYAEECLNSPCQHNGICQNILGSYKCQCAPQWTGQNCTIDVDECLKSPCQHNGLCRNIPGFYICRCTPQWTGQNCTIGLEKDPVGTVTVQILMILVGGGVGVIIITILLAALSKRICKTRINDIYSDINIRTENGYEDIHYHEFNEQNPEVHSVNDFRFQSGNTIQRIIETSFAQHSSAEDSHIEEIYLKCEDDNYSNVDSSLLSFNFENDQRFDSSGYILPRKYHKHEYVDFEDDLNIKGTSLTDRTENNQKLDTPRHISLIETKQEYDMTEENEYFDTVNNFPSTVDESSLENNLEIEKNLELSICPLSSKVAKTDNSSEHRELADCKENECFAIATFLNCVSENIERDNQLPSTSYPIPIKTAQDNQSHDCGPKLLGSGVLESDLKLDSAGYLMPINTAQKSDIDIHENDYIPKENKSIENNQELHSAGKQIPIDNLQDISNENYEHVPQENNSAVRQDLVDPEEIQRPSSDTNILCASKNDDYDYITEEGEITDEKKD